MSDYMTVSPSRLSFEIVMWHESMYSKFQVVWEPDLVQTSDFLSHFLIRYLLNRDPTRPDSSTMSITILAVISPSVS